MDRRRALEGAGRRGRGGAHDADGRPLRPAPASPVIDLPAVWQRIKVLQASIAVDEARRGLIGVDIVTGTGVVTGPQQVTVDGRHTLEAAAILLATGSRPLVPAIEGLATPAS